MGERGTTYFHSLPKRNVARIIQNEILVSCPEREGGVELSSDSSEMLRSCRLYYERGRRPSEFSLNTRIFSS